MRILNRLLALIVSVALVGTAIIIIVEVIAYRSGSGPVIIHWHAILDWAQRNTWKATSVELACWITAAAGLILLVPQLIRRRVSRLRIDAGEMTDAAISRKGVTVTIRGAVAEVDGVATSQVKVGRRTIRVNALTAAQAGEVVAEIAPQVEQAASEQIEGLRLRTRRTLRIRVDGSRPAGS